MSIAVLFRHILSICGAYESPVGVIYMRRLKRTRLDLRIPREAVAGFFLLVVLVGLGSGASKTMELVGVDAPQALADAAEPMTQSIWPSRGEMQSRPAQTGDAVSSMTIRVYNNKTGKIMVMDMEEYILGVTAAEVPASYHVEAIKAQAVAARTYAAYEMEAFGGNGYRSGVADASTSSAEFQAFADEATLRSRWGSDYDYYMERVKSAVEATRGQVITYQNKPIHALFHAVSGGRTEDVQAVFNMNLPYLKSVVSAGEENAPRYEQAFTFTRTELTNKLNKAYPKARLTADGLQGQIEIKSKLTSGQVDQVRIGNTTITGREFRKATGIGSANFTLGYTDTKAVVYTVGFGHGVGMSQAGANAMAQSGNDYRSILLHYYTGVQIENLSSLL